jgi:hypothetical protein
MAKTPIIQYGITITKPWSDEMYKHNALVLAEAKENIQKALDLAYDKYKDDVEQPCFSTDKLHIIAKEICGFGWAMHSAKDIYEEATDALDLSASWWINDIYPYLYRWEAVPPLSTGFVGF